MDDVQQIIILATFIFLLAPLALVIYISVYNRRKKRHIEEKENLKIIFQQELLKAQIEVQEQTLGNVGRELHDNITQVLSFVKLNLARVGKGLSPAEQQKIEENRDLIARAISDLKHLSKSLSFEHIMQDGLINALSTEVNRINASEIIALNIKVEGEPYSLGEQRELILFRIFQEAFNNAIKYADASRFNISLQYSEQLFNLTLEDDGVGFHPEKLAGKAGLGLKNMQNRAAMMGAVATISSAPGSGCSISVVLNPKIKQLYTDGPPPNSIS